MIKSSSNPALTLERTNGRFAGLDFANSYGTILKLEACCESDGGNKQFAVYIPESEKYMLIINDKNRKIFDYKTKFMKEILVDGDVSHFQPGEVFSFSNSVSLAGFLTTSAIEIFFTIPLPKDATGRTVNVACTDLRIRGNAGYLVENKDISEYKIRTTISTNLLSICISQASGKKFYDTNNIAVTVAGIFTITFS